MIGSQIARFHPLSKDAQAQFDAFHALLTTWNARIDLTAVTDDEDALFRHYLDSLIAIALLPQGRASSISARGQAFPVFRSK